MAAPHGWTSKGQERGAMVLKSSAPQATAIKLAAENRKLKRQLDDHRESLDMLKAALKDKGILPADDE